ncbi:flagellar motor switch protein FliG [Treponema sp. OMZ 840]|uniref:flagellar motor switch protein FliG n=1 Tax=Treponema sp. OMZ 840 TaxID=244313 RepID=UPI003D8AE990
MNLNDKRIQAYKQTAGEKNGRQAAGSVAPKVQKRQSLQDLQNLQASSASAETNPRKGDTTVKKMRTHIDELMERDGLLKLVKTSQHSESKSSSQEKGTAAAPLEADSVYRRVAKFLLLIGVNEAAKVLPHLTPEQTEKIIPEIASIRSVDTDEASVIFAEFRSLLERSRQAGGVQTARSILEKAFGEQRAQAMLSKAVPFPDGTPFDYLQEISAERLTLLLKDEAAPVQTLVLSRLKSALAAAFIKDCDKERQKEIISRMAKLPAVSTDVVRRVDRAMREKLQNISGETGSAIDGRSTLAAILKKMDPASEKSVLSILGESDPELSEDLRNRLFTIDDIVNADDRFIQELLRSMSDEHIAVLIAGKEEKFRTKILQNMSKGRGDTVLEEEQLKIPVRKKDSDEVTHTFFSALRRAWEEGRLVIKGRDDDVYV